jgi:hypothetical protein
LVPTKGWKYLFDYLGRIRDNASIPAILGSDHSVSMNLKPINNGNCGTVEFRRPPGVAAFRDAKQWVVFALAFKQAGNEALKHVVVTYLISERDI